jgi:hypothetical protein
MDLRLKGATHFERAFPQALILMTRPCSLSRSNSSAHHRIIRTALLSEFGGMGIGATVFIRLLMRKLTFDRIRLLLAAFVQER